MIRIIIILGVILMLFGFCPLENGWKGIKLFQINRVEVEKILGQPMREGGYTFYKKDKALIRILYSDAPCSYSEKLQGIYNVPKDTVIKYSVILEEGIKLSELEWEKDLYDKFEDPHIIGNISYGNLRDGITFTTYVAEGGVEKVGSIDFDPTKEMVTKYACPSQKEKVK